jgi:Heparinase II/III-like protein
MDCVNGPAVPLAVEVLERVTGRRGLLFDRLGPDGAKPVSVLRMVARSFMPGGLLLPWDNYGYQWGVRSTLAYGARTTGEPIFRRVLENECIWTYDIGIGWAYDDLVWTLIWWPDAPTAEADMDVEADVEAEGAAADDGLNWYEPLAGGTLVSADGDRYVMQMWDQSAPGIPTRSHVNPNALLFNGFRTPISADGAPTPESSHRFQFDDTWRQVDFLAIDTESRYNYGDGCAGAHSVIVVDGAESMRAHADYPQTAASGYDGAEGWIEADVTPIYRENFPDLVEVRRRTQLHLDKVFTVEDSVVSASEEHLVTSRFLFRPDVRPLPGGIRVETPEGVTLQLVEILGGDEVAVEPVANHPHKPDGRSVLVDFSRRGREVRRLFVGLISRTVAVDSELADFRVVADADRDLTYERACAALRESPTVVPMRLPAYMEADLPNATRWWYARRVAKRPGGSWLRLPVGMHDPRLFVDGHEVDLSAYSRSMDLVAPLVRVPASIEAAESIDVVLRVDVPKGHYDGQGDGTIGMTGGMGVAYPVREEVVETAKLDGGCLTVTTNLDVYRIPYELTGYAASAGGSGAVVDR